MQENKEKNPIKVEIRKIAKAFIDINKDNPFIKMD